MRKPLFFAALVAMAAGLGAIYWSWSVAPSIIADLIDPKRFLEVNSAKLPGSLTAKPNLPQYRGQSLNYLGDPLAVAKYPKEFVDSYRRRLETAISLTNKSPKDENYWIEIGIVKKAFDNYSGARDAWEYARLLNPENPVVYYNLANLYALYLRDFKKAEENYEQSLTLNSFDVQPYLALAEFYKDFYTEKSDLVDDVLLDALKIFPNEANLILNLAIYYKSVGEKENAIKYFEEFLKLPDISGTQQEAVKSEIDGLR